MIILLQALSLLRVNPASFDPVLIRKQLDGALRKRTEKIAQLLLTARSNLKKVTSRQWKLLVLVSIPGGLPFAVVYVMREHFSKEQNKLPFPETWKVVGVTKETTEITLLGLYEYLSFFTEKDVEKIAAFCSSKPLDKQKIFKNFCSAVSEGDLQVVNDTIDEILTLQAERPAAVPAGDSTGDLSASTDEPISSSREIQAE